MEIYAESIGPFVFSLNPVYECPVGNFVAARGRVVTREIPVTRMFGTSNVEVVYCLEDNFNLCLYILVPDHLSNLVGNLFICERSIDLLYIVIALFCRQGYLGNTLLVNMVNNILHIVLLK